VGAPLRALFEKWLLPRLQGGIVHHHWTVRAVRRVGLRHFGRPYGTLVIVERYPALKRGAKFGRPSGAARWAPLHAPESGEARVGGFSGASAEIWRWSGFRAYFLDEAGPALVNWWDLLTMKIRTPAA